MRRVLRVGLTTSLFALGLVVSGRAEAQEAEQPQAPATGQAPVPAPATARTGATPSVRVVFEPSEPHVVLERRPAVRRGDHVDSEGSTAICVAGCDVMLDPKAAYQVGGTWVTPASFMLPPGQPGPFRVRAVPGSSRSDGIGTGIVLAGGGALVLGGSATTILLTSGATKNARADDTASYLLTAAITTAALGLLMILVSVPFRSAGTTHVTVQPLEKE